MSARETDTDAREERLYEQLGAFLDFIERGLPVDTVSLFAEHSEFASELGEFLETYERLERVMAPLRASEEFVIEEDFVAVA